MADKKQRRRAYRKGQHAEWLAAGLLVCKGFRIVARRYKTPVGEVDLIARKKDLVVFVEVKARASAEAALNDISFESQRRIEAAAYWWLGRQSAGGRLNWRIDVIAVLPWRLPQHFINVW